MIKVRKSSSRRICQGDVFRDIEFLEYASEKSGIIEVSKIVFPLVIVLTQDCDLEQDYQYRWSEEARVKKDQDKWLLSVLVAPLYNADHVFQGSHLSNLNITMQLINRKKTPGDYVISNQNPRYHYFEFPKDINIVPSIVDFKHYFSVNINYLKKVKRRNFVCRVSELFREDISQRFASFLARVALPER